MATIRKRRWLSPSGEQREAWQVSFTDQDGKRRHKQFDRKKNADAYLVKARGQVAAGTYTPDSSTATIEDAADAWIARANAERLERSSIEQYERSIAIVSALLPPETRLARLTHTRVEQLRDDLLRDHSRAMAQKALKHFKGIIKDAKRRGLISHDPAAATTIGTARRHRKRLEVGVDVPTPDEIKAMVGAATDLETKALVCLAAFAGLRASEIRGLRWSDLDLGEHPTVTVRERADKWGEIGSPKSEASQRTVPLGEITARALKEWRLAQPPLVIKDKDGKETSRPRVLVFGTSRDTPDGLNNIQRRQLDPLQVKAGVTSRPKLDQTGNPVLDKEGKPVMLAKYSIHKLRHYAISSWLRTCQGDFKRVQAWAGHGTLALTLDTYGHLIPRTDDHAMIADAERGLFG